MSVADIQRIIALEMKIADLAEHGRMLVARIAALEDHLAHFQATVETRHALDLSVRPCCGIPVSQRHPNAAQDIAQACPSCRRHREQAQARLRRHRAKLAAADGGTSREATA
jgi:hypothetical protein